MNQTKSIFYISVMTSLMIMMCLGTVYGGSVTVQHEDALQQGQEVGVSTNNVNRDDNQLRLAPRRLKDKTDPGRESSTGSPSVRMERYKPYQEGEGERKIGSSPK